MALVTVADGVAATPVATVDHLPMYTVRHWSVEDGLPQNRVCALAQTPDGYLWLGTWFGLARFDGVRFTLFNRYNTPALANDVVNTLAVAPNGALWVGTRDGLVRLQDRVWRRWTAVDGLPEPEIWGLLFDRTGALWVETGGHAGRFPSGPFFLTAKWPATFQVPPQKLVLTPDGKVSTAIPRGLAELAPASSGVKWPAQIPQYDYALAWMPDGNAGWWVGTASGFWHCQGTANWSRIWPSPTEAQAVNVLFRDSQGSLWAGVRHAGLHRLNGSKLEPYGLPGGDHSADVNAMLEDHESGLWVATEAGLYHLHQRFISAFTRAEGLPADYVWSISEGLDGAMWVATDAGLARIHHQKTLLVPNLPVPCGRRCVLVDRSGTAWFDYGDFGLMGVLRNGQAVRPLSVETVHALALDREGRLWVGTSGGAHCLLDGKQIPVRGLATNEIRAVYQTSDGAIWFGTKGHGVERWFQGELQRITTADGLCDDRVFTFHEDADGFLWIGTHNGLSRISLAESHANGKVSGIPLPL